MTTLQALITKLASAEEGSRELDVDAAILLGWRLLDVSQSWEVAWHNPEGRQEDVSRFTSSLDASLPGENIVEMKYGGPAYGWAARQDGQKDWAYAKTEILARRLACLKAMADD